jgi:arylsulfatase A-like enzyme
VRLGSILRTSFVPPRRGWWELLVSPTGYLFACGLAVTVLAKTRHAFELGIPAPLAWLAWAILADVGVFAGLAAVFAALESRWPATAWLTVPVAAVLAVYSGASALYLVLAGEQGSWQALQTLRTQFEDVEMVAREAITPAFVAVAIASAGAILALPIGLRRLRPRSATDPGARAGGRARAAAPVAVLAIVALMLTPRPRSVAARAMGENAIAKLARTTLQVFDRGDFEGYVPATMVAPEEIERFAAQRNRPNVLLVVLESTRLDHTSLAGAAARIETPAIAALAARGLTVTRARAVVPHTTKSLFGILCARHPTMQRGALEVAGNNPVQCLPEVLRRAGYHTGFFQSAYGTFEQRPRLVHKLGFEHFRAWEEIRGRRLGYLASDDASLEKPVVKWLGKRKHRPFFATVLTSATHHPYRLPPDARARADRLELPQTTDAERYARLVEAEDALVGRLVAWLDEHDLSRSTIVVVVGDHGEGFGDHGIKQHDNDFYEEGLRVPLVLAGPGVPAGILDTNASLVDLSPTLAALLGLSLDEPFERVSPGRDLLSDEHRGDERPIHFACYSSWRCRGFVLGHRKVVYAPEADEAWYFDLRADPDETEALGLGPDLEAMLPELHAVVDGHRTLGFAPTLDLLESYGGWWCPAEVAMCMHPRAAKSSHRYQDDQDDRDDGERVPFWRAFARAAETGADDEGAAQEPIGE